MMRYLMSKQILKQHFLSGQNLNFVRLNLIKP